MSKKYKYLNLTLITLFLVLGIGVSNANATLTLGSTNIITDGAFTLTSVGASEVSMFAENTTGNITIGGSQTTGNILLAPVSGNIGIGITTPRGILETADSSVLLGGKAGGDNLPNVLSIFANQNIATGDSGYDVPIWINHTGGGAVTSMYYAAALADTDATNYSNMVGINGSVYTGIRTNDATASTITAWSGVLTQTTGIYGLVANLTSSTGTISTAYGGNFQVTNSATGIIRNAYGLYTGIVSATGTDIGRTHNAYGLYIANNVTATGGTTNNAYALYSASTKSSYFAGNIGIGTTSPAQKLEVNGGVRLNTVTAKPTCDSTIRGTFWAVQSAAGVKDTVEVCAKDAGDAYAWRELY
ncbi:MAG: hypothetical protein WC822_00820 [Candidatus Paceibacterota bacterium]|jgi:hypothetical protein